MPHVSQAWHTIACTSTVTQNGPVPMPGSAPIVLTWSDGTHASEAVVRSLGASLNGLTIDGRAIIPADTEAARERWFGGFTLAPWPNRLRGAHWSLDGIEYRAQANDDHGHALHGLVHHRDFDVAGFTTSSILMAHTLGADAAYPWPLRIEVSYALGPNGLTCTIGATNLADRRLPVAVGVHPYLAYDDACTITVPAKAVCDNDATLIPTGALLSPDTVDVVPSAPVRMADLSLDHCFTQLTREGDGLARTRITYGDGSGAEVWQDAAMPYLQLFTKRDFPWAAPGLHGIGIEPQTAPANALQTGTDLHWLEPSESWTVRWGIRRTAAN